MGTLPVLLQLTCRKNRFSWLTCTILFPSWCKNLSALSQKMDTILSKSNGGWYKAKRCCRKSGAFKTNQYNPDAFSFREKSKLPKIKCSAWDHSSAISQCKFWQWFFWIMIRLKKMHYYKNSSRDKCDCTYGPLCPCYYL